MSKLVRDKIPEIMRLKQQASLVRTAASDEEYFYFLIKKLVEEVNEFIEACSSESSDNDPEDEVADILEVIDTICKFRDFNMGNIQSKKTKKYMERGGFDSRVLLMDE